MRLVGHKRFQTVLHKLLPDYRAQCLLLVIPTPECPRDFRFLISSHTLSVLHSYAIKMGARW